MNNGRIFSLSLCAALCVVALAALLVLAGEPASAQATTRYVATTGTDSGNCTDPGSPCRTVQYAVDRATSGDLIKVANGTYSDVNSYGSLAQVVYVDKTVTIRGGYTAPDFTDPPDPDASPTTLDAEGQGRVLYITGNISPTIEGLRITGGDSDGLGGAVYYNVGGGIYVITATAIISNNQVFSNTTYQGGGLYLWHSDATLIGNTISGNDNWGQGGGLYLHYSDATLIGNTITANTISGDTMEGGGLYLYYSDAMITGNTISDNDSGLWLEESDGATISGNTISDNDNSGWPGDGGGLHLYGSDATISGNTISGNTTERYGGGLYLIASDATVSDNIIGGNTARQGGGLFLDNSDATLINNMVTENQAEYVGGGLYIGSGSTRLLHTTIVRNRGGDGSGIYVTSIWGQPVVALTNTVLVSQTVGVYVGGSNPVRLEGTLWGSRAWANGTDWVGVVSTGTVNVWGDPAFVDPAGGDYHIGPGSAAVDAGVASRAAADIDGDPRPDWCLFDIGADELMTGRSCHRTYLPLILRKGP